MNHWAMVKPDATAVVVGTDSLTYGELQTLATERLRGTAGDTLTMLCQPNGTDVAVGFMAAVAGTGRCAVLDPLWPGAQRDEIVDRLRRLDAADRDAAERDAADGEAADGEAIERVFADGPGESVFLYGLTSGTTSVPKCFTRTRASWQLACAASTDYFGVTERERTLVPGPLSASLSLYALTESLYAGAAIHALSVFDVGAAIDTIVQHSITRLVAVPAALRLIVERGQAADVDGSSISSVVSAGAALDARTLAVIRQWIPGATVYQYYGAAELNFVSAEVLGDVERDATAVGAAFPGVEISIRDNEGNEVSSGVSGEIFVRSALVSNGYSWGDDGRAFRREGDWCTVGDLGTLDADRILHHLGRGSDMIVTSGHNVYPHEVEATISRMPGVDQVVVTGTPDPRRGRRVVAAILGDNDLCADELRGAVAQKLAGPKRPRTYLRLKELPLTPAGKVSRRLLEQWIVEGDARVRPLG
ncbi:class I adenylate-forming enzyme family protein [Leifsonia sp. A12D58]|uniref:class I adenylate-forming enzyme family protein n=1 Tax=Leifsonia sp. A12D58 TaxID=3397674 RepID=UPI0039E064D9